MDEQEETKNERRDTQSSETFGELCEAIDTIERIVEAVRKIAQHQAVKHRAETTGRHPESVALDFLVDAVVDRLPE